MVYVWCRYLFLDNQISQHAARDGLACVLCWLVGAKNTMAENTLLGADVSAGLAAHVVTYGDIKFPVADLPLASLRNAIESGITHKLGSEVAAQVVAAIKARIAEATKTKVAEVDKAAVQSWRAANPDAVKTLAAEIFAAKVKAIKDGTLSDSRGGPRGPQDPVQTAFLLAVEADYRERLAKQGITTPSKADVAKGLKELLAKAEADPDGKVAQHFATLRAKAEKVAAKNKATVSSVSIDSLYD